MLQRSSARLILMCGLPGAGKSTLARQLGGELPALRLCGDDWIVHLEHDLHDEVFRDRLERAFWAHAQQLLALGQSVILESGFWLHSDRDEKRLGARALGVAVELRVLEAPVEELWRRVEARNHEHVPGNVEISRAQFEAWVPLFEAPDARERAMFDPPA